MIVQFEDVIENHYNKGHKNLPAFRESLVKTVLLWVNSRV